MDNQDYKKVKTVKTIYTKNITPLIIKNTNKCAHKNSKNQKKKKAKQFARQLFNITKKISSL